MTTSVLVQQPDGSPFYETQTIMGVTDTLFTARGSQNCGNYKFSVISIPDSFATALTASELFFDASTPTLLKVYTD